MIHLPSLKEAGPNLLKISESAPCWRTAKGPPPSIGSWWGPIPQPVSLGFAPYEILRLLHMQAAPHRHHRVPWEDQELDPALTLVMLLAAQPLSLVPIRQ